MRSLIVKIAVMLILAAGTSAGLWFMPGNYLNKLSMMINKKELMASKKPPRIILLGGSNLLGVRSRLLHETFRMDVVNFGCWAGFKIEDIFDSIDEYFKPGDVIIIVQEYFTMSADSRFTDRDGELFTFLLDPGKTIRTYVRRGRPHELLPIFYELMQLKVKSYIRQLVNNKTSRIFKNGLFFYPTLCNEYGDRIIPFHKMRPLGNGGVIFRKFSTSHLDAIYRRCREKGMRAGFCFAPFPEAEYMKNEKAIAGLYRYLQSRCPMPLLNAPLDNVYPERYFADTVYHLTDEGEDVRTARLVRQMKLWFLKR
jgi:hypothetical protein